jgi:hypothetical protein
MGLDSNAYAISRHEAHLLDSQEYRDGELALESQEELAYWRKNPHLHRWMAELAVEKKVCSDFTDFNCDRVWLTLADIETLEEDYCKDENGDDNMPDGEGHGMLWGCYDDREITLDFIRKAKAALNEGKAVYYTCWW